MDSQIAERLLALNQIFYNDFAGAFAATRRRIQPGVRRILNGIRPGDWLDLGCGSGALGHEWAEAGLSGSYTGMDFSGPLLEQARADNRELSSDRLRISYIEGNLMNPDWNEAFASGSFDGVLAFASLHHVPGADNHRRIFHRVRGLLRQGGQFIFSVWQFQNSEKLMKRVQPWESVGLSAERLEPGDTLLDWRYALPNQSEKHGLRYVHLFSENELTALAHEAGFEVRETFYSDGAEGTLGLYMILSLPG